MAALTPKELGQLIMDGDPYTSSSNPVEATEPVEVQVDLGTWQFKGVPFYIEKAMKIPYTYKDINGHSIQDYILVGYAGGGAY